MQDSKKAVFIVNLGSPDSFQVEDVRRYLRQFLMDKNVLDSPYLIRKFVLEAFILPKRPAQSAEAYESIWWKEGSPLIVISQQVFEKLKAELHIPVGIGMRYGNPSTEYGMVQLMNENPRIEEVLLIPLYPHFAMSSFETAVDEFKRVMKKKYPNVKFQVQQPFYKNPEYISALANTIRPYLNKDFDKLLFSYHGIPERHLRKSDPTKSHCLKTGNCCEVASEAHNFCYRHQVHETTKAVVNLLGLKPDQYSLSFQSRLGKDPWLTPFTDKVIDEMPSKGVKKLLVVCPSFVSDCLETLEEIGMAAKESFIKHGGESFELIPCMNDNADWIEVLKGWANSFAQVKEESCVEN